MVQRGGDSWFLIELDQVFGAALAKEVTAELAQEGGKLVGVVRHPLNTSDFSSLVLQAQEFGLMQGGQQLVSLLMFISDVKSIGLQAAQGLVLTEAFYRDLNDESRAFSKRFFDRNKKMPTSNQAGDYSATLHYLKAIEAAGTDDATQVMAKMRAMPIKDPFTENGRLRVDGRMVHDMYLVQVKKPEESKGAWISLHCPTSAGHATCCGQETPAM